MTPPFEVIVIGQCTMDHLAVVDPFPKPDSKTQCHTLRIEGGGPAATAAVALARWGVSCAFFGVVGGDSFGAAIRRSLEQEGVDATGLQVRAGHESQVAFILCHPSTDQRTIVYRAPTGPALRADEVDLDWVRSARALHVDGLGMEAALAAAKTAHRAGVPVIVDAGSFRPGMQELAGASDYFVASEPFARAVLDGGDNPAEACRRIAAWGPRRLAGVTLGAKGYLAWIRGRLVQRPSIQVEAKDTTGCGDLFHAAITFGAVQQWPTEQSLDLAAWAAAQCATAVGGRTGIPSLAEWPGR
jgi:ribokinase